MSYQKEYIVGLEKYGSHLKYCYVQHETRYCKELYHFYDNPKDATHFNEEQARELANKLLQEYNNKDMTGFIRILEVSYNWHETFCVHKK